MATTASVMPGMAVLPQFAGDAYKIQRQQALANALMSQSLVNEGNQLNQAGAGMRVMPRMNPLQPLVQALGGYYSGKMADQAAQAQQALGQQQMAFLMGDPGQPAQPTPQPTPDQATPQPQPQGTPLGDALLNQPAQPPVQAPTAPQPAPAQPPATTGRPGFLAPGGPMNPAGIPGPMAAYMYLNSPDKYWEAQAAQYAPTDASKMARASGADPRLANALALQKAVTNVENVRPGGTVFDNTTRQPIFNAPTDGQFIQYTPNGPVSIPVANAAANQQAWSQAQAAGKAAVTPMAGVDEQGNPTFTNQLSAATGAPGGSAGNGRYPGGAVRPSLSAAGQAAATETGKGSAEQLKNDNTGANGYASRMFTLNKALAGLQNANTGPGSEALNNIKSFIAARGIPGVDVDKIASYDEANKYLMQYAIGQAGALGEGTDGKLAATLSGNANTHISNLAAQDVVRANMGLERMKQAQVQQFNNTGLPPEQYQKWATQWNKSVNPQVFIWDSLPTDKKQAAMSKMTPAQRQGFTQQYNWALQNKFIDGPQ